MSQVYVYPFAEQGHFTAVHNFVFRRIMPVVSPNAFKVLCFIIDQTIGYQRKNQGLSYEDIREGTGIGSDETVRNAVAELLDDKLFGCPLILRRDAASRGASRREKTRYALNLRARLALQKSKSENPDSGATKTVARRKTRTTVFVAFGSTEIEERENAPIKNARDPVRNSNRDSNSLSPRAKKLSTENQSPESDDRFNTPHFHAVLEACAIDPDFIPAKARESAADVAAKLATKYTPDQIRECGQKWPMREAPHPSQLLSRIKAILNRRETPQTDNATPQRTSAPKFESAAERRERDLTDGRDDLFRRRVELEERKRKLEELETPCPGGWGVAGLAPRD